MKLTRLEIGLTVMNAALLVIVAGVHVNSVGAAPQVPADPRSGPVVKLTASANGSALGLPDDANGGVQLYARDTASFVRVVDRSGRSTVVKP